MLPHISTNMITSPLSLTAQGVSLHIGADPSAALVSALGGESPFLGHVQV